MNHMTWQLNFIKNHQQTGEYCLELCRINKPTPLRCWFGPMAQHLLQQSNHYLPSSQTLYTEGNTQRWGIEKQLAQHLLVEASFFHQRCLHQYQVNDDIKSKGLDNNHDLSELLLFIRMSAQHPSHQTLITLVNSQQHRSSAFEDNLNTLLSHKLIQKIGYNNWVFYDKNPYPHDHLLDLSTFKLHDFSGQKKTHELQLLICHTP